MFNIANARFAFLDIETTGLSPWFGDRICQIAIVLTEGKRIKSTVDLLINPDRTLSPSAVHINGLDESKLSAAPKFAEIADQLEAALKDAVVVCHNAKFDIQFLDNEFRKLGRTVEIPNLIDTPAISTNYPLTACNILQRIFMSLRICKTRALLEMRSPQRTCSLP